MYGTEPDQLRYNSNGTKDPWEEPDCYEFLSILRSTTCSKMAGLDKFPGFGGYTKAERELFLSQRYKVCVCNVNVHFERKGSSERKTVTDFQQYLNIASPAAVLLSTVTLIRLVS